MASLDLPYRCPRCGEHKRFRSLSSLRAHLEYSHTYETLYILSKTNSICDGAAAAFPLAPEPAALYPPMVEWPAHTYRGGPRCLSEDPVERSPKCLQQELLTSTSLAGFSPTPYRCFLGSLPHKV